MNNPKIYGFCPAGCKWETVHRNEFDASKSAVPIYEDETDHTYHLTNKDINLLEENPYHDVTQHFKVYDGTGATASSGGNKWQVDFYATLYINDVAVKTMELEWSGRDSRSKYEHEIDCDLITAEVNKDNGVDIKTSLYNYTTTVYIPANIKDTIGTVEKVGIDIFVKNIGYPYTKDDGTTTERVDGCENTRVYAIGFGKGFWGRYYSNAEIDEKLEEKESTANKVTNLWEHQDWYDHSKYADAGAVKEYVDTVGIQLQMHINEAEQKIGDIDTALDSILAIQNELLGGATE